MPPSDGPLLGREKIEHLVAKLGYRCSQRGLHVEMFLVGGAAMVLAYGRKRATRDLDAVFEPKMPVYEEVRRIADEEGLPPDWINDAVKGLLPDRGDDGEQVSFESEGISVAVASAEYLFAMKALSARQEADSGDLLALAGVLGVTTAEQAFAIVERFYRPARLTAKASIFVQSVLGGADLNSAPRPSEPSHQGQVYVARHVRRGKPVAPYWRRPPTS